LGFSTVPVMVASASTKSSVPEIRIDPLLGLIKTFGLSVMTGLSRDNREALVNVMGGELMFCAHLGNEYAEKLAAVALKIQDETERLVETK
jgi:hypothetical protein